MSHKPRCVSCGNPLQGHYCAHCGEKRIEAHDLTIRHFLVHAFEAFTHADGKIFGTLRALLFRPGQLTADYMVGRRRAFIGPLQLFLICNVIYFLTNSVVRWDSLSSSLTTNMNLAFFHSVATPLAEAHMAKHGLQLETYRETYDKSAQHYGKTLVIILVPLLTVPLAVLFRRKDRPLIHHVAFAFHFGAFFLVALMLMHSLTNLTLYLLKPIGVTLTPLQFDLASSGPLFVLFALHLHAAIGRAYDETGVLRTTKMVSLVLLLLPIVTVFRFALFLVTLWAT